VVVAGIVLAISTGIGIQALRSASGGAVVRPPFAAADGAVTRGASTAKVSVVEYGDFQCPHCAEFQRTVGSTIDRLVADGTIRFGYVPMAFLGPESELASNAAYCAGAQGRFWPYHDELFANQAAENSGALTTSSLTAFGATAGVTGVAFDRCVESKTYVPFVERITTLASQRGITSTPTVLIDGTPAPASAYSSAAGFIAAIRAAGANA
jgi:protein-disulfide isomerase